MSSLRLTCCIRTRRWSHSEQKRAAAVEEELWRHKQMVTKVREEDFQRETASFEQHTLTPEQADAHPYPWPSP